MGALTEKSYHEITRSLPRVDARDKVLGSTRFLTDIAMVGMVHAYPVYSPVPFAEVLGVDISDAMREKGFIGCYLAKDIPGKNQVGVIIRDQPLLADGKVRYIGDTVAVVVAETEAVARRSASLVHLNLNELTPILSIKESQSARENLIHDTNIACTHRTEKGDIEMGFSQSGRIIESTFKTPYQEHYYLEPQGCIVVPDPDGGVTVTGSLQCPYYVQKAVAGVLGLPFKLVRVVQAPTGGAFGGKEDVPSEVCARTALAAWRLKRPVKMVYDRHDDVQLTSKRHPFEMHFKVGVTSDGKLVAADITLNENAGAYATLSSVVSYRATMQSMGPYEIPNIRARSTAYYTNLPPAGAFRGFGSPQVAFGHERMMDIIAGRLGIDPLELRLKNVVDSGSVTITGQTLGSSVGARETMLKIREASGWDNSDENNRTDSRYLTGTGIASAIYGNCLGAAGWSLDGAGVWLEIHRDGSVDVAYGLVEMGQGSNTAIVQMTAEALGIDPGRITVLPTTTTRVPDSGPSVASRNIVMTGNAILAAAKKILPVLKTTAAKILDCTPENLKSANDQIMNTQTGQTLSFAEMADALFTLDREHISEGWWHVPELDFDPDTGQGEAYFTYSYATQAAQVTVDTLTGQVRVDKIWAAHDVGQAINPAGIEAQVEGGTTQGLGWALMEDFQMKRGRVITPNLSTYLIPTSMDVPPVETIIVEHPEPLGPWGAKGIGEPAIIPTAAAIANAVSRATGVEFNEIPITPEKVLWALKRKNEES